MATYAMVNIAGFVDNIIVIDSSATTVNPVFIPPGGQAIEVTLLTGRCGVGYGWDGNKFIPPLIPPGGGDTETTSPPSPPPSVPDEGGELPFFLV